MSAAYHLATRANAAGIPHRIVLFDSNGHVGGRAVHPVDVFGRTVELGATSFPAASALLVRAAANLRVATARTTDGVGDLVGYGSGAFGV